MAYDFPNNPTDGQIYPVPAAAGQAQYQWIASRNHWISLGVSGSPPSEQFVPQTGDTGSAVMPSGTSFQRDGTPREGYTRWNQDLSCLEVYDGAKWICLNDQVETPVSLGDLTVLAGTTVSLTDGNYTYDNLTIENTGTLRLTSKLTRIRVLNNISIAGTLYLAGNVPGIRPIGHFQNSAGGHVNDGSIGIRYLNNSAIGEGAGLFPQIAGDLYSPSSQSWGTPGFAGGGSVSFAEGSLIVPSQGGSAGGGVILTCDSFLITSTGLINANGESAGPGGAAGSGQVEGSGGGTGGFVSISCDNYQQNVGSSITVDGGNGSLGINGGAAVPVANVTSGGGGGGGGIIYIETSTSYTNNGTLSSTGGITGNPISNGSPSNWTVFNNVNGGSSFGGRGGFTVMSNAGITRSDATNGYAIINGARVNL